MENLNFQINKNDYNIISYNLQKIFDKEVNGYKILNLTTKNYFKEYSKIYNKQISDKNFIKIIYPIIINILINNEKFDQLKFLKFINFPLRSVHKLLKIKNKISSHT